MQELWDWIDAHCHEENFNINDAKQKSLDLETKQIVEAYEEGQREMALGYYIKMGRVYYNLKYKI